MNDYYDYNEYYRRTYSPQPDDVGKLPMMQPPSSYRADHTDSVCKSSISSQAYGGHSSARYNGDIIGLILRLLFWALRLYLYISVVHAIFLCLRLPVPFTPYFDKFYEFMLFHWRFFAAIAFEIALVIWAFFSPLASKRYWLIIVRPCLLCALIYATDPHLYESCTYLFFVIKVWFS